MEWGDTYSVVKDFAVEALTELKALNFDTRKKGNDIYKRVLKQNPNLKDEITENAFKVHLSYASKDPDSRITKNPGSQGYFLRLENVDEFGEVISETKEITEEEKIERIEKEKLLYPLLEMWLQKKGFRSKVTASMKSMGQWGNPDITGVIVEESLGSFDIEITTIEAKISGDAYKYDIFEAISHRRFANRSYFAFSAPKAFINQDHDELRYYSELFQVGIIVIALDQETFTKLKSGGLKELDIEEVELYELYSAPYENKQLKWQKKYLSALGITDTKTLWSWGD